MRANAAEWSKLIQSHPGLRYLFDNEVQAPASSNTQRLWHQGNYGKLCKRIQDHNWEDEFAQLTAHQAYKKLTHLLLHHIDECVPSCDIAKQKSKLPWKTSTNISQA